MGASLVQAGGEEAGHTSSSAGADSGGRAGRGGAGTGQDERHRNIGEHRSEAAGEYIGGGGAGGRAYRRRDKKDS